MLYNTLCYTVQKLYSDRDVLFEHPISKQWVPGILQQDGTFYLKPIPAGVYRNLRAMLDATNPAIIAVYPGPVYVADPPVVVEPPPTPLPTPEITIGLLPDKYPTDAAFEVSVSSTNLVTPLTLVSSNPAVASVTFVNGKWLVAPHAVGGYTLTASQVAGNGYRAGSASRGGQVIVAPAIVFVGAFSSRTPSASEVLAAPKQPWDTSARTISVLCNDEYPGWAEPKTQGIRTSFQNSTGADETDNVTRYTTVLNGVEYWLYTFNIAQYDTEPIILKLSAAT